MKKGKTTLDKWWLYLLTIPIGLVVAIIMDWIDYYRTIEEQ